MVDNDCRAGFLKAIKEENYSDIADYLEPKYSCEHSAGMIEELQRELSLLRKIVAVTIKPEHVDKILQIRSIHW